MKEMVVEEEGNGGVKRGGAARALVVGGRPLPPSPRLPSLVGSRGEGGGGEKEAEGGEEEEEEPVAEAGLEPVANNPKYNTNNSNDGKSGRRSAAVSAKRHPQPRGGRQAPPFPQDNCRKPPRWGSPRGTQPPCKGRFPRRPPPSSEGLGNSGGLLRRRWGRRMEDNWRAVVPWWPSRKGKLLCSSVGGG